MSGRVPGRKRMRWRGASAPRAAVALLVAAAFRLLAQAESFLDPGEFLSLAAVRAVLSTAWGRGWWWQVGQCSAGGAAVTGSAGDGGRRRAAGVGDAAADGPRHGCAKRAGARRGAAWCARLCRRAVARHARRWRSSPGSARIRRNAPGGAMSAWHGSSSRFSPVALASAGVLVVSGYRRGDLGLVGSLRALRETAYGQRLLLKLGLLVVLLAVGCVQLAGGEADARHAGVEPPADAGGGARARRRRDHPGGDGEPRLDARRGMTTA